MKNVLYSRTREYILRMLYNADRLSSYKIAKELDIAPATAIDHLQKLIEEGMVSCTNAGSKMLYSITQKGIDSLISFISDDFDSMPQPIQKVIIEKVDGGDEDE